jgi:hypothetical protein
MTLNIDTGTPNGAPQDNADQNQMSDHDKAMLEKSKQVEVNGVKEPVDPNTDQNQQNQDGNPEDRPAWLPDKFKTVDDFVKSYGELEKKLGSRPADPKPADPVDTAADPAADPKADTKAADPLDFNSYFTEWSEKGSIGDESYAQLQKAGIPKDVVDAYIAGAQALQVQRANEGFAIAGGQENYTKMTQWAKVNLQRAEIDAFNNAISGSPEQMQLAIRGMHAKYESAVGKTPALLNGSASSFNAAGGFRSKAEVVAAMNDSRYESDSAYRNSVMQRLSLTAGDVI